MSNHEEQTTAASEPNAVETFCETGTEFPFDLFEERIKANLEPLNAQISALTLMMGKFIQDNSARAYPTASILDHRFPSESPVTDEPGTSRTLPLESLGTAGYSANS